MSESLIKQANQVGIIDCGKLVIAAVWTIVVEIAFGYAVSPFTWPYLVLYYGLEIFAFFFAKYNQFTFESMTIALVCKVIASFLNAIWTLINVINFFRYLPDFSGSILI